MSARGAGVRIAALLALLAIATFLRFRRIGDETPNVDELEYTRRATAFLEGGSPVHPDHPPLFWTLTALVRPLAPDAVVAGRLVSATAGVLHVLGTVFLFRASFGTSGALLAGLVLALLSFHVHASRMATLDVLFLAFMTWGYGLFLRSTERRGGATALLSGLLIGLGAATKFPAGGAMAALGLLVICTAARPAEILHRRNFLLAAGFVAVVGPVVGFMLSAGHSGVRYHTSDRYAAGDVDAHAFRLPDSPLRAARDYVKVSGAFDSSDGTGTKALASAAVAAVSLFVLSRAIPAWRRRSALTLVLLHSVFYGAFFTVFPVKFPYYHLTEAAMLLPAAGAVSFCDLSKGRGTAAPRWRRPVAMTVAAVLAGLMVFNAGRALGWPRDNGDSLALIATLEALSGDGPEGATLTVALDSGFFDLASDLRGRGRVRLTGADLVLVRQDVALGRTGAEVIAEALAAAKADALVCTDMKATQKGWVAFESLLGERLGFVRRHLLSPGNRFLVFARPR